MDSLEPRFPQDPLLSADDAVSRDGDPPGPLAPGAEASSVIEYPIVTGRPRWWTTLAVIGVSLVLFVVSSSMLSLVAVVVASGAIPRSEEQIAAAMKAAFASRTGLFVLVVVPQLAMVSVPITAALLSPEPIGRRLGLVRGHWPIWAWLAGAAATPLVGLVSGLVVGVFLEESDSLRQMTQIFRGHGEGGFLVPLALMIGVTPAVCEELLFRGYLQTRLVRSTGPAIGILMASFLFAAFHMDLVHVLSVFPLGVFLGWLSWQSGSLYPAMLGHFVNNVISVLAVVMAPDADPDVLALPAISFTVAILGLGILGMAAVTVASVSYGAPRA